MKKALRVLAGLLFIAAITFTFDNVPVNATTAGFAYLITILLVAARWGRVGDGIDGCRILPELFLPSTGSHTPYRGTSQLGGAVRIPGNVAGSKPALGSGPPPKFATASTSN